MSMDETNPYRPPQATLGATRNPGRYRPLATVLRVLVGLWGLFVLAGPDRDGGNAAEHHGEIAGKALGALLFMAAVFPIGKAKGKKLEPRARVAEDL